MEHGPTDQMFRLRLQDSLSSGRSVRRRNHSDRVLMYTVKSCYRGWQDKYASHSATLPTLYLQHSVTEMISIDERHQVVGRVSTRMAEVTGNKCRVESPVRKSMLMVGRCVRRRKPKVLRSLSAQPLMKWTPYRPSGHSWHRQLHIPTPTLDIRTSGVKIDGRSYQ